MADESGPPPSPAGAPAPAGDAFAAMRHPLAVLAVLLPIGLLGEFLRWAASDGGGAGLLSDPLLGQLGLLVGLGRPFMAPLVLTAWCLVVLVAGRQGWRPPAFRTLVMIVTWGVLWAVARCTLGLACHHLIPDRVMAQAGLLVSGALQEELLFRGLILGLLVLIGRGMGATFLASAVVCVPLSAVFFSLAHTVVVNHHPGAELFTWPAFIERGLAGVLYGYVFLRHGLAASTLAHLGYLTALELGLRQWY
jgi:hypothetical protein